MPSPPMHHEPDGDRIRAACQTFLSQFPAVRRRTKRRIRAIKRPVVIAPEIIAPPVARPKRIAKRKREKHTAEWLSEHAGRVIKAKRKAMPPPEGYKKYQGETWNRFHGMSEFKIKINYHSYHLGYFPYERHIEGALKYDRVAFRVWGNRALWKMNFPDHEQLKSITVDGVPADPLAGDNET